MFSSFKSVIGKFYRSFLNLFLDTWIRIPNTDPDPGPNWTRIQPDPDPKHCEGWDIDFRLKFRSSGLSKMWDSEYD
jgi:hypothetical protein